MALTPSVYHYNQAIETFRTKVMSDPLLDKFFDDNHLSVISLRIWAVEKFFQDYFFDEDHQKTSVELTGDEILFIAHHPEYVPIGGIINGVPKETGTFKGTKIFRK